jgi:Ser/Thr protein kinase RdoA (MazF antagonist)
MKAMKEKTSLQKAVDLLEEAGFEVNRAYLEDNRDAGNAGYSCEQEKTTGNICLRISPVQAPRELTPEEIALMNQPMVQAQASDRLH